MAALRAQDGFVLAEMGAHTANAGRIYFPAGTPDPGDVAQGQVDLAASVLRELTEETGLTPDELTIDPDWLVVDAGPYNACMKLMRSPLPALDLAA
jgi:8-oxo-dGTP pyrophosphatase MutT (NUDIX family)